MMLNLTEVMPGGCTDSDTLRSRDCVTGDSFLPFYHFADDDYDDDDCNADQNYVMKMPLG